MYTSLLSSFKIGDVRYLQGINTKNDCTYIINDETEQCVFKVDADGYAYDAADVRIGMFRTTQTSNGRWVFIRGKEEIESSYHALTKAEVEIFKKLMS